MNDLKSGTVLLALLVAIAAPMTSHAAQSSTRRDSAAAYQLDPA